MSTRPGASTCAAAVDDLGIAGGACVDMRPEIGDDAVVDQYGAARVEAGGRIDEPRVDEGMVRGRRDRG